MKKIISVLLVLILLLATPAFAYSEPKLALNPANHTNPGAISGYNEAAGMIDLSRKTRIIANRRGIKTEIFWNGYRTGGGIGSLMREVGHANKFGPSLFVAMHSDGVPKSRGIFVLYKNEAGKRAGAVIGSHIAKKMGLKFEGLSYRPGLYVLRHSKSPAILIEYLSHANLEDNKKLNDDSYRQKLAEATVEGYALYGGIGTKQPEAGSGKQEVESKKNKPSLRGENEVSDVAISEAGDKKQKAEGRNQENVSFPRKRLPAMEGGSMTEIPSHPKFSGQRAGNDIREKEEKAENSDKPIINTPKDDGFIDIISKEIGFKPITKKSSEGITSSTESLIEAISGNSPKTGNELSEIPSIIENGTRKFFLELKI